MSTIKKIKITLISLTSFAIFLLTFAQNTLADLLPPGNEWSTSNKPSINSGPDPKTFTNLIKFQDIIIGGTILIVVITSFMVLFKIRKK